MISKGKYSIIFFLVAMLAACSGNYQIQGHYPTPLVPSIPIDVSLELDEEFKNYVYADERQRTTELSINLGQAQTQLFETIATTLFNGEDGSTDLIITPQVDGFQYTVPRETRSQIYEVWIKYKIAVKEPEGRIIGDWVMTGYGKTPTAALKTQGEAINAATNVALRDIGTQLSIGFKRQPDIALWLAEHLGETPL